MTVERMFPSGGYCIYTTIRGYLFLRRYFGYTRREAIAEFRAEAREARKGA